MPTIKTLILRAAGTNCDQELGHGFELAGSQVDYVHVNEFACKPKLLDRYKILGLPGGFTYGDDIGAGNVLANELNNRLKDVLPAFVARGGLILGICNGFQVLVKTGMLPEPDGADASATLTFNDSRKFEDRWVYLKGEETPCVFWKKEDGPLIYVPVAHGEGKFIAKNDSVLKKIKKQNQVVFRYANKNGTAPVYPDNPNGSPDDIAGICDPTGRILGMMPHPERHLYPYNHPRWTRRKLQPSEGDGLRLFRNAVTFIKNQ